MSSSWSASAMVAIRTKTFIADDRGGPLVEMAVLLLPFMLLIAMVIEGGNILWRHQIALKAARDTTRYISRKPLLFDETCALDGTVLAAATVEAKTLGISGLLAGGPPLIANWTEANIEVTPPAIITANPCLAIVQTSASVDLPLPFAPIFQLVDPDQADTVSFSVADRARWLGE